MQCSDKHTDTDIERRNRLIEDVYPALRRMAGRHRQKAGLPWQYRDDLVHDMVITLCEAYERHSHLPDDAIKRVMVRAAYCDRLDASRQHAARGVRWSPCPCLDLDQIAYHDSGQEMVDTIDEVVDLAKRAGWTRQELQAVLLLATGHTERESRDIMGLSSQSVFQRIVKKAGAKRVKNAPQIDTRYQPHGDTCQ